MLAGRPARDAQRWGNCASLLPGGKIERKPYWSRAYAGKFNGLRAIEAGISRYKTVHLLNGSATVKQIKFIADKIRHPHLIAKDGWWHFFRRVPKRTVEFDVRRFVKEATKINVADDPKALKATKAVIILNEGLEADWRDLIAGRNDAARSPSS